ncbi:hypothetical protein IFR04_005548 [Cadophora malorum]|uniref:NACHT domain-containing protein n=1 Tax=Cadophora malorum TaxID=108018 RepID=A0A8H7TGR9_9HELO|nr:hypothetical protein IFR04_005548 [Cadophora malorum]
MSSSLQSASRTHVDAAITNTVLIPKAESPLPRSLPPLVTVTRTQCNCPAVVRRRLPRYPPDSIEGTLMSEAMTSQFSSQAGPKVNGTGFTVLHQPPIPAIVDIIFVHGLQGHARQTWACELNSYRNLRPPKETSGGSHHLNIRKLFSRKHSGSSQDSSESQSGEVFWPLDLLPDDCPDARILTYGYDSKVSNFFGGPANQSNIIAHARDLTHKLKRLRLDCPGRSIIFVAHSLGGIIVKCALCRAADNPAIIEIFKSTKAVFFLGTPHRGSGKASIGEMARRIASASGLDTFDQNLRALQVNSIELEMIHESFVRLYEQNDCHFQVITFQETKGYSRIAVLGLSDLIVQPFSSSFTGTEHIESINANHMDMCRFSGKDDQGYQSVVGEMKIIISTLRGKDVVEPVVETSRQPGVRTPSQVTMSSFTPSLNDVERSCIAILAQNTSDASEQKSALESRVEGTCQWILSNPLYTDWDVQKKTSLLWISGYPGSGKTILSAFLLEYLNAGELSPMLRRNNKSPCYFFCDETIENRRDGTAILRSLIHQLVKRRRQVIKYLKAAYDLQGPNFYQNFNELWRIFIAIASDKRIGSINVIVDAIDECEEATRSRLLQSIIKLVDKSRSTTDINLPQVKFLVTSRPQLSRIYPLHQTNLLMIDPSGSVEDDLRLVIQARIAGIVDRTRCKPEARIYLEKALYAKADRTFLWVTLVLHLLEKSFLATQKDFEHIVDELPQDLTATYERFLQAIPKKDQEYASKLLHFIVGSSRPLTLEEMRILIALDEQTTLAVLENNMQPNIQETIEGALGPLVRIWDSHIYLIHLSLKEFLLSLSHQSDNPLSARFGVQSTRANWLLAEACICYLLLDDFSQDLFSIEETESELSPVSPSENTESNDIESLGDLWDPFHIGEEGRPNMFVDPAILESEACGRIEKRYSFYDYAATHWTEHFAVGSELALPELKASQRLLSDARDCPGLNWLRYYWFRSNINMPCPKDFGTMVTACYFGHQDTVDFWLERSAASDTDMSQVRGLFWAARNGHANIVEKLVKENVSPDVRVADGCTALIVASQFDRGDVVQILLRDEGLISPEKGHRVNYAWHRGRTPLSIVAGNGSLRIVRQLLEHGHILPDLSDFDQWTPLFYSVFGKHLDVLQTLLSDPRVSPNHVDRTGRNAMSWAASEGHTDIVKYLLSLQHMRVEERDQTGRTALSWAAGSGHLEVTIALRHSRRFDISSKDNDGRNALSWACHGRHYKVVEYLVKHDRAGVNAEDVDGWTPLAWALFGNAPKTVQALLSSGLVDVNKRDHHGRSPLSFAAGYGYLEVVTLLMKVEGIEVNSTSDSGKTPLSVATANGHIDVVKALQEVSTE